MIAGILNKVSSERRWFLRACQAVPAKDALRLATTLRRSSEPVAVWSRLLDRRIWVRPRSSDFAVFMKVLGDREYAFDTNGDSPAFIVDAGANIGLATLYFASKFPQAHIAAIEPEPSNLELLRRNCAHLSSIKVFPAALWSGRSDLFIADPDAEKWTVSVTEKRNAGPSVPAISVSDVLRECRFEHIDILKLDIEGAERELFRDGWQEWLPRVRMIMIELHDRFVPGCSQAFYSAILSRPFQQEINGENVIIHFES